MDILGCLGNLGSKTKSFYNWLTKTRKVPDTHGLKACKFQSSGSYGTCIYLGHYDGSTVLGASGDVAGEINTLESDQFTIDTVGDVETLVLPSTIEKDLFGDDALKAISNMRALKTIGIVNDNGNSLIGCYIVKNQDKDKLELLDKEQGESFDGENIQIEAFGNDIQKQMLVDLINACFERDNPRTDADTSQSTTE